MAKDSLNNFDINFYDSTRFFNISTKMRKRSEYFCSSPAILSDT